MVTVFVLTLWGIANSATLTISPPRVEYFAYPGGRVAEDITISSDDTIKVKVGVGSFKLLDGMIVEGDDGRSCATWVQIASPNVVIYKEKKLRYLIKVPKDVPKGSYYASLVFQQDTEAMVKSSIIVYLYVVVGKPAPKGEIVDFKLDPSSEGLGFLATFKNLGDFHYRSKGNLTLTSFQNGKVIFGAQEVVSDFPILPYTEKTIKIPIKKFISNGEWTARLTIDTGRGRLQKELKFIK
jgi:hypothetical protein